MAVRSAGTQVSGAAVDDFAECDVAIVGYGPTGATLACLLAQGGMRVVVVERATQAYPLPRAVHFDDETMRVFQTVGIADALRRRVRVNPGMRFVDHTGALLLDWPRPPGLGPQGWNTSFRLHQPDLEALLRAEVQRHAGVTVWTGCQVTEVTQSAGSVVLRCEGEGPRHLNARYVVGCDGARSTVRASMGAAMQDLGFHQRWLVIDVVLTRARPDLGDHTVQFCDPDHPMTYCRNPGARRRWEIALPDDLTDAEATDSARIWHRLARWITPDDATLERAAVYTFRSAIAESWRRGRVFVAGDAAHLTPPFMGQGMCAGIRDAANLAWKLARAVQGKSDLLDSYATERIPHVRHYITTAVRLGSVITAMDRDMARDLSAQQAGGGPRMASQIPRLGPGGAMALDPDLIAQSGVLFGQPTLSDGRRMDDVVGYAPVLVSRAPMEMPGIAALNGAHDPSVLDHLDVIGAEAALIRPDRYVWASVAKRGDVAPLLAIAPP